MTRTCRLLLILALGAVATGCAAPLSTPGRTGSIQLVSSTVDSGYRVEYFRNLAYPCSISGFQTFAIAHPEGQPRTSARPLWTYLHGGAVGWFDGAGQPQPDDSYMREESLSALLEPVRQQGLMPHVLGDGRGFRLLIVSMCNRDIYGGAGQVDPNNPNRQPNGQVKTTNGLLATKAALQFTRARLPTTQHFLHGDSAGSVGTYSVGWSLQQQGLAPAGIVADSFIINQAWMKAALDQHVPCATVGPYISHLAEVKARIHPDLGNAANDPDRLVSTGRLTVPVAQVWSHGDPWGCGSEPMACPLRDGTSVVRGSTDCMNEPMRRAIRAQGQSSRSLSLSLCVAEPSSPSGTCGQHVVTAIPGRNTDPGAPADYNAAIMAWVRDRLIDDGSRAVSAPG